MDGQKPNKSEVWNLATNETTGKDSAPIGATGTENVGVRVPRAVNTTSLVALEVDLNEGATNNVPQRVKSKLHMAAGRQGCKTCNGADALAVRTLLRENCR